jgi:cytochrome P450
MLDTISSLQSLQPPAPVPKANPLGLLALLRVLATNPLEAWTEAHFNEPIVAGGLPFARVVVVSDPAAIRRVLLENCQNYQKDWLQRRVLSAGMADGLLAVERQRWRAQRRALAPLFALKNVRNFATPMVRAAKALVERLSTLDGETVDIAVEVTRVTLDVLEHTIFSDGLGTDRENIRRGMRAYFQAVGRLDFFDVLGISRIWPQFMHSRAQSELHLFETAIDNIITVRRRQIASGNCRLPDDLLSHLLRASDPETGKPLDETEVRANILTFIAAGHETTANCVAWTLYLLSQSSEWRMRVHIEADRELDGDPHMLTDRLVETRAVIDESNRLYPPIAAISRSALGLDELAGYAIRKGTMVVIAPYVLHRHRALWSKPDHFNPSRFLGAWSDGIDRFSYLPFGAGPRTCIGAAFAMQEASIIVAEVTRQFRLEVMPGHKVFPIQRVTLQPMRGMPMVVHRL